MNLQHRIALLTKLRDYMLEGSPGWQETLARAEAENGWFISLCTEQMTRAITLDFLDPEKLGIWAKQYKIPDENQAPKTVGIVMAGNIPLVGFHDWLAVFISGHKAMVKLSSKDSVLLKHLVEKLTGWDAAVAEQTQFSEMLKGCDAYIATGSNQSALHFEYYFARFPHIIRRNRTSVAILTGSETTTELEALADDVFMYFGLGCRNVTKIYVPEQYDFVPLLTAFRKYSWLADHHKYRNNYDYNLALHILNKVVYMSSENLLLVENKSLFSPISQLHYEYYPNQAGPETALKNNPEIQCIAGEGYIPFGQTQRPGLTDYADGVDTLAFLAGL